MTKSKDLTLYRGFTDRDNFVWSPFVSKLEFRLRQGQISYDYEPGSTRTAPKGKVPYVDFHNVQEGDPTQMGDTSLITDHLIKRGKLPDLNASLSETDKLADMAIRAMIEEKLFFYNVSLLHFLKIPISLPLT